MPASPIRALFLPVLPPRGAGRAQRAGVLGVSASVSRCRRLLRGRARVSIVVHPLRGSASPCTAAFQSAMDGQIPRCSVPCTRRAMSPRHRLSCRGQSSNRQIRPSTLQHRRGPVLFFFLVRSDSSADASVPCTDCFSADHALMFQNIHVCCLHLRLIPSPYSATIPNMLAEVRHQQDDFLAMFRTKVY